MSRRSKLSLQSLVIKKIKQARKESGLTLAQLAREMHLSGPSVLSRYESGKRPVSLRNLSVIANVTGRQVEWFFNLHFKSSKQQCYWQQFWRAILVLNLQERDLIEDFIIFTLLKRKHLSDELKNEILNNPRYISHFQPRH